MDKYGQVVFSHGIGSAPSTCDQGGFPAPHASSWCSAEPQGHLAAFSCAKRHHILGQVFRLLGEVKHGFLNLKNTPGLQVTDLDARTSNDRTF